MPIAPAVVKTCKELCKKFGVHTVIQMASQGFKYNGDGDTAVCVDCGLEVSNWTSDMMHSISIHNGNQIVPSFCYKTPSAFER